MRDPVGADRRAAAGRDERPRGGVEQLRRRRLGPRAAARREADPADGRLLRGGEQGVRAAVPPRRARGRADPAGHPGRADARRGAPGIPAFFTATGGGTQVAEGGLPWRYDDRGQRHVVLAGRRRRASSRQRSARVRPRGGDRRRLRAGPRLEGRPARQPRLPRLRAQLQPARGDVRAAHHRRGRAPRRDRRAGPQRRPHPGGLRAAGGGADARAGRGQADREAHRAAERQGDAR